MSMEMTRGYTQSTKLFLDSAQGTGAVASVIPLGAWNWNGQNPPPLSGQVRTNTRDWATATQVVIDKRQEDGTDMSAALAALQAGEKLRLEHQADASRFALFTLTAAPTLAADAYTCTVTPAGNGGTLPNSGTRINVGRVPLGTSSSAFDGRGYGDFGVLLPSNFKGTTLTFLVSSIADGNFTPLYAGTALVSLPVTMNRAYTLPDALIGWPFWKLVSNGQETDVNVIIVAQA